MASTVRHTLQGVVGLYGEKVKARNQTPFSPQCWWQHAVGEVCRTSNDPHAVKNALRLFPTSDNTVALLSNRGEIWLNTCLQVICEAQAIEVPRCNSSKSAARNIVDIARRRRPPLPSTEDRVISNLTGTTEPPIIADNFNAHIENMFSMTIFRDWVALCFGYRNDFLDKIVKVRDRLIGYAQGYGTAKLASVLEALPSQQPLARWILSTAISHDISSDPITSLRFIIDPIERLLTEHRHNFPLLIQHLLIIEARFHLKVVTSDKINWSAPFSMDFSLWRSMRNLPPQTLAISITKNVEKIFSGILHGPTDRIRLKGICQNWTDFAEDIRVCLKVDTWVKGYVKELVDCFLSSRPRNIHLATAIGSALSATGFQPCEPWAAWDIIKPDGNFAGCATLIAEGDCLPYVHPLSIAASMATDQPHAISGKGQKISREILKRIRDGKENTESGHFEMREQQNTSRGDFETIRDGKENTELVHFEMRKEQNTSLGRGRQEVGNTVQNRTFNGHLQTYAEHLPPSSTLDLYPVHDSSQLKRKALIDTEQFDTKRAAVGVSFSCPDFTRNQQHQDSMFDDPVLRLGNDTSHFALDPQGLGLPNGRNSGIEEMQRDLHTAEPNFDGQNSATLRRLRLPRMRSPRRADSKYMTLFDTERSHSLVTQFESPHVPPLNPEIHLQASSSSTMDPEHRTILPPISCLFEMGSKGPNSEIYSQVHQLEDQTDQGPTIERDSNHTKNPSPSIALHGSGGQKGCDIMNLLNPEVHQAPLEGTPSCIDTNAQRVKFAELLESQYSMTVSQVSTPRFASNPSVANVEGCRYLKTAPTLQGSSTVRMESFEKMNQDPVQHETLPQPTQTLVSEENPARLLATPKPSPEKNVAVAMGGKNTGECGVEDPFRTHLDSVFPSTCELLDAVDWTGTSVSQDLTKAVPKQPRKHPGAIERTTQDLLPTTSISSPKQDFLAFRKGSSSEVGSQEDDSRTTQRNPNNIQFRPECLNLTDEQCRRIQDIVDEDNTRIQKCWEFESQPQLIRLYMAGESFPQIESAMKPELFWSYKTYYNRFREWKFPVDPTERDNKIKQLYALVSESMHPTPLRSFSNFQC